MGVCAVYVFCEGSAISRWQLTAGWVEGKIQGGCNCSYMLSTQQHFSLVFVHGSRILSFLMCFEHTASWAEGTFTCSLECTAALKPAWRGDTNGDLSKRQGHPPGTCRQSSDSAGNTALSIIARLPKTVIFCCKLTKPMGQLVTPAGYGSTGTSLGSSTVVSKPEGVFRLRNETDSCSQDAVGLC